MTYKRLQCEGVVERSIVKKTIDFRFLPLSKEPYVTALRNCNRRRGVDLKTFDKDSMLQLQISHHVFTHSYFVPYSF